MSFDFNYKFWVSTKKDIDQLIQRQNVIKKREPIEDSLVSFQILSQMYVLYADLATKLGYLYQNTFQIQKRDVVRKLLEPILSTLMFLKNELKSLEFSEFVYVDNVLVTRKITPYDIAVWRTPNFLYRRPVAIQNIFYGNDLFMDRMERERIELERRRTLGKSIVLIQSHERARQARIYRAAVIYDKKQLRHKAATKVHYRFRHKKDQGMSIPVKRTIFSGNSIKKTESCKDLFKGDSTVRISAADEVAFKNLISKQENAALKIQRTWRKYKEKKLYNMRKLQQKRLYGILKPKRLHKSHFRTQSITETYKNEMIKQKLDDDYIKIISDERTRLLQQRAPQIMEDISDHIRGWFKDFYDKTGDFHPYPEVSKQGTILVLFGESMNLEEFREFQTVQNMSKDEKKARAEKAKLQKQKEKEKMKKQKLKEAKRRKKLKDAGIYDIGDELERNKDIESIENTVKQYSTDWKNVDEYLNNNHDVIKEWVTESELANIHKELRILVDEFMRLEYELLRQAWSLDNSKSYKPAKEIKPKEKKERRKKKLADPTESRSIESLYHELKEAGIIEKCNSQSFDQFISEFNFLADDLRNEDNLVTLVPTKADIKSVIQECMLGFGDFMIEKPKSICIVGPQNNGKELLCRTLASELDAVFMNLSPERTYQFADNLNYFIQVVMKVAKAFQPTVLFIYDAHRIFWRKVPKEQEDLHPTLLQGIITKKILKSIKKDDKILLLGTSDSPWSATGKFKIAFQKILLVPKSDYGTAFLLWLDLISQRVDEYAIEDYVLSALAKVFRNYHTGHIVSNVDNTLSVARRMRLHSKPLHAIEFLDYFMHQDEPIFQPEEKDIQKHETWFARSNVFSKLKTNFLQKKQSQKDKKK